jgi:hypothetical protein
MKREVVEYYNKKHTILLAPGEIEYIIINSVFNDENVFISYESINKNMVL